MWPASRAARIDPAALCGGNGIASRRRHPGARAANCASVGELDNDCLDSGSILARLPASIANVPADAAGASGTGVGPVGLRWEDGAVAFATTHWSVVLEAQGHSPAAQEALEKLCRTYWRPVYCFVRRQGAGPEEAEDLTQGFFVMLLERRDLDAVRREKGRLRSYLLTSLKHFLASEQRRAMAIKRGKGQRLVSLEELSANERIERNPQILSAPTGFMSAAGPRL